MMSGCDGESGRLFRNGIGRWAWERAAILGMMTVLGWSGPAIAADQADDIKTVRKTCGSCPDGYAMTGVTSAPEVCKDGNPTLVQCVPLGASMLAVCGQCPEGYAEVGRSNVPARCGAGDGGLLAQCQLPNAGSSFPDPNQGGLVCPPHCGSTGAAGQGAMPPPPKVRPAPDAK